MTFERARSWYPSNAAICGPRAVSIQVPVLSDVKSLCRMTSTEYIDKGVALVKRVTSFDPTAYIHVTYVDLTIAGQPGLLPKQVEMITRYSGQIAPLAVRGAKVDVSLRLSSDETGCGTHTGGGCRRVQPSKSVALSLSLSERKSRLAAGNLWVLDLLAALVQSPQAKGLPYSGGHLSSEMWVST